MQLLINSIDGLVHPMEVASEVTIGQIKAELGATEHVLSFAGRILDAESATLADLEIGQGSTLNINARLLGGKVHGSLARAGKVRAQTPKVEKQEKKKKKSGRACRRLQYNRRFVNVVSSGPGRKRGPNSNAA